MSSEREGATHQSVDSEKRFVALSSLVAAVCLTTMKLVVGLMTGSLGILSEALHSGLDLMAAAVTLIAVQISGQPADREHTYGHGKVENLSALFETVLLLVTCIWIIYEAVQRLFYKNVEVEASGWAFLIMGVSIIIDISRSKALARVARKYDSQALEADALHFSTDVWSSSVVIVGLVCVFLSERLGLSWLAKADALAALAVAGIVVYVSVQLGTRTIVALLDGVPAALRDQVARAARVPGVLEVKQVRVRRSGPEAFADINVTVSRSTPLERAHDIASAVEVSVRQVLHGTDVMVHVAAVRAEDEGVLETIRLLAAERGLGTHSIRLYDVMGGLSVELHLDVADSLSVTEAHDQAAQFESALRKALPAIKQVVTHIEPSGEATALYQATLSDEEQALAAVHELATEMGFRCKPHELTVHRVGNELALSFHCTVDGNTAITDAHAYTEQIEKTLRSRMPQLSRVVIHVEPPDAQED